MTQLKTIVTGAAAGIAFLASAVLAAQEVADVPVSSAATNTATSIQEKISETVSGVVSGEISAAEHGLALDTLLQRTFMRITDCWTLCRQEMILAKETARQEAIQTAKDIFKKRGQDDDNSRKSILDRLPPLNLDDSDPVRQAVEDVSVQAVMNGLSAPAGDPASAPASGASVQDVQDR